MIDADDVLRTELPRLAYDGALPDWDAVVAAGTFDVVEGPDTRSGARGDAQSLYVRDPDRNVVELRYYPA